MKPLAIKSAMGVALLGLGGAAALAEDPIETAAGLGAVSVAELVAQPIPREFCVDARQSDSSHLLPDHGAGYGIDFASELAPAGFAGLAQTDGALDRLIRLRRLELLTLMRGESADVFFGVNERGWLGVHLDASQLLSPDR